MNETTFQDRDELFRDACDKAIAAAQVMLNTPYGDDLDDCWDWGDVKEAMLRLVDISSLRPNSQEHEVLLEKYGNLEPAIEEYRSSLSWRVALDSSRPKQEGSLARGEVPEGCHPDVIRDYSFLYMNGQEVLFEPWFNHEYRHAVDSEARTKRIFRQALEDLVRFIEIYRLPSQNEGSVVSEPIKLKEKRLTFNGRTHTLTDEQSSFLDALIKARGRYVSSSDLAEADYPLSRPDRIKANLHGDIQAVIEPKRGSGYRLTCYDLE